MHGYIYPAHEVQIEGSDRWSEGSSIDHSSHERSAWTSKDHPSRSNGRTMVEPYLSITSKDQVYPSRLSFDQNIFQLLSKSNRRMVDLVNLQHKSGHRLYQTEYRQSTDTSAPTNRIQTKYRHKCTNTTVLKLGINSQNKAETSEQQSTKQKPRSNSQTSEQQSNLGVTVKQSNVGANWTFEIKNSDSLKNSDKLFLV
ncbi:hypothetical protein HanPSC8_Chr07g0304971 [Helianthus annuus]|nr:hypothetical protein HanPSC8_Chr07g0304971 [Helianthus annuus]